MTLTIYSVASKPENTAPRNQSKLDQGPLQIALINHRPRGSTSYIFLIHSEVDGPLNVNTI